MVKEEGKENDLIGRIMEDEVRGGADSSGVTATRIKYHTYDQKSHKKMLRPIKYHTKRIHHRHRRRRRRCHHPPHHHHPHPHPALQSSPRRPPGPLEAGKLRRAVRGAGTVVVVVVVVLQPCPNTLPCPALPLQCPASSVQVVSFVEGEVDPVVTSKACAALLEAASRDHVGV